MQRSESRRKAALSNFSDEGIEGQLGKILGEFRRKTTGIRGSVIADGNGLTLYGSAICAISCHTVYAYLARLHHWSKLIRNNKTNDIIKVATARAVAPA